MSNLVTLEGDEIVIRIHKDTLKYAVPHVIENTWGWKNTLKLIDEDKFFKDFYYTLMNENEIGDTMVMKLLDSAVEETISAGSEGIRYE